MFVDQNQSLQHKGRVSQALSQSHQWPPTPGPWVCGQKPQRTAPLLAKLPVHPGPRSTDPPRGPGSAKPARVPQHPALPVGRFPLLRGVVAGEALQGLGPTGLVTLSLHKVCKDRAGKEHVSAQHTEPGWQRGSQWHGGARQ